MIKSLFLSITFSTILLFIFTEINVNNKTINVVQNEIEFTTQDCSNNSYCADGYTLNGIDRLGNVRGHNYEKNTISITQYISSDKYYDHKGYDQFGFNRIGNNINGIYFKKIKNITY
jgi:hypothetical protein